MTNLKQALTLQNIPEITQTILNLAEFMEHCEEATVSHNMYSATCKDHPQPGRVCGPTLNPFLRTLSIASLSVVVCLTPSLTRAASLCHQSCWVSVP